MSGKRNEIASGGGSVTRRRPSLTDVLLLPLEQQAVEAVKRASQSIGKLDPSGQPAGLMDFIGAVGGLVSVRITRAMLTEFEVAAKPKRRRRR